MLGDKCGEQKVNFRLQLKQEVLTLRNRKLNQDQTGSQAGSAGCVKVKREGLTAMAYMVMLSLSLSPTACSSCGLS